MPRLPVAAVLAALAAAAPASAQEPHVPTTGLAATFSYGGGGELGLDEDEDEDGAGVSEIEATLGYEFGSPGVRFQGGIPAALLMLNGTLVERGTTVTRPCAPTRLERILMNSRDDERRLDEMFLATLTRLPRDEERARFLEVVRSGGEKAFSDVMAALLNSAEFLLTH